MFALKCWVCDSNTNPDCGDPFHSTKLSTIYDVDCGSSEPTGNKSVECIKTVDNCKNEKILFKKKSSTK